MQGGGANNEKKKTLPTLNLVFWIILGIIQPSVFKRFNISSIYLTDRNNMNQS